MNKVRQKILIVIKLGRIKIKIDKSWGLPFSVYAYSLKKFQLGINRWYQMLEFFILKLNIIFCIEEE
jgi:hypothetical protein